MPIEARYAEVAVNTPAAHTYHYHIPPQLAGRVRVGHLVRVAFGTAQQPGIVIQLHDHSPVEQTKPLLEVYDPEPVVTEAQIAIAEWIASRFASSLGLALWLFLPPKIAGQREVRVSLVREGASGEDRAQQKLIDTLARRGTRTGQQLNRAVGKGWRQAMQALTGRGIVSSQSILTPPKAKPKVIKQAALAIAADHIPHVRRRLGKSNRASDLLETLMALVEEADGPVPLEDVYAIPGVGDATVSQLLDSGGATLIDGTHITPSDHADEVLFDLCGAEVDEAILRVLSREADPMDVSWVYAQTGAKLDDLKRLETNGLVTLGEKETLRDPLADKDFVPVTPPRLTPGQKSVWREIKSALDHDHSAAFLLHGVTGSGKTEIYLRAIHRAVNQGKTAIFLVPEIALTPQTVRRVMARFPGRAAILHSHLTDGERYDTWRRARQGEIDVVVGTRSALFAPLPDLGLIILDEEHDPSYKQSPPIMPPYYHARDVAERMMLDANGVLILGSATPDVETMFRAEAGHIHYLHMPDRIMGHRVRLADQAGRTGVTPRYIVEPSGDSDSLAIDLPDVQVIDMRDELKSGNTDIFSRALQRSLRDVLARGEQAILFLNRRGASTYVFCRDCGYVAVCPNCDTPLTYHTSDGRMHCHHCNYRGDAPNICPECGSARIKHFGAGTQHVEAAFKQHFPDAVALRWDSDSASKPGQHDLILDRFTAGQADVLIGTQMIAKGHDLPLVTLVGVVSADIGLNLPDYHSGERAFQLLTQVAGRAGRGLLGGNVILQTYQPEHYAIRAASSHNYPGFYATEIAKRRETAYPPFRRLVRVLIADPTERRAQDIAERAADTLRRRIDDINAAVEIIGPVPCFFGRIDRRYRWQVILRGADPLRVFDGLDIPRNWYVDVDPVDLL